MTENDENVRVLVEPANENMTREQCKEVLMDKLAMDFEMTKKLVDLRIQSPEKEQLYNMVERTKVIDTIYMKHQTKLHEL